MEDDRNNRHENPLKAGWNLILESILEESQDSQILAENHQTIHQSLDELNRKLQHLSQYRHHLNCRLEVIKKEVERLQLHAAKAEGAERVAIDHEIMKFEDEGYSLQVELEELESRLKKIRVHEREL